MGINDFLIHGNVSVRNENGVIKIESETYDFLPNPRDWYPNWFKYAVRNIETYGGFYVASFGGFSVGEDFTINYTGSPSVVCE